MTHTATMPDLRGLTAEMAYAFEEECVREVCPEIIPLFYPRRYVDVGNYFSPRRIAFALAQPVWWYKKSGQIPTTTMAHLWYGLTGMIERRFPLLFTSPDMTKAIQRTEFLDELDWVELKLPYESGVLVPPRGAIRHPDQGSCEFIAWLRLRGGQEYLPPLGLGNKGTPTYDGFRVISLCSDGGVATHGLPCWFHTVLTSNHSTKVKPRNMFLLRDGEDYPHEPEWILPSPLSLSNTISKSDDAYMESVSAFLFGVFSVLNARPELLERERCVQVVKPHKGRPERRYWTPNILGRHYVLPKTLPQGGTHASPRMHWRRGHFRNQACGAGRKEHKTIWLEPVLVAAHKEETGGKDKA